MDGGVLLVVAFEVDHHEVSADVLDVNEVANLYLVLHTFLCRRQIDGQKDASVAGNNWRSP